MHILAIFLVLSLLCLSLAVIGGMLFAHSDGITAALTGHSVQSRSKVTLMRFEDYRGAPKATRRCVTKQASQPLLLAA